MGEVLLKNNVSQASPSYELITELIVTGATASNIDLTGLNITKDDVILLVADVEAAANGGVGIYFNGNYTATNYYTQRLEMAGTTITAGERSNSPIVLYAQSRSRTSTYIKITEQGYITWLSSVSRAYTNSGSMMINDHSGTSTFTSTTITSIRLNLTNGLGIGTRVQLFKLKAEIVFDTILSSPQTNVDISNLTIEEDSEYLLVSDVRNATANQSFILLTANGNNTSSNYYRQNIYCTGTTNGADRENNPRVSALTGVIGGGSVAITRVKLTNNGYFTWQSLGEERYGGNLPSLFEIYGVSTFTSTSVTSLRLAATVASSMNTGSRFILYKLK